VLVWQAVAWLLAKLAELTAFIVEIAALMREAIAWMRGELAICAPLGNDVHTHKQLSRQCLFNEMAAFGVVYLLLTVRSTLFCAIAFSSVYT
jgi:hypothetical protein